MRKFIENKPYIICFYCRQKSYGIDTCVHRKGTYVPSVREKLVWMSKASSSKSTNISGPKRIWVLAHKK